MQSHLSSPPCPRCSPPASWSASWNGPACSSWPPNLDPGEGSLGVHIDVSHKAATPVGFTITVDAECIEVRGPRAKFSVRAHDGIDEIGSGTHERFIVSWDRFNKSVSAKTAKASPKVDA
jgi:predicted thioesterase